MTEALAILGTVATLNVIATAALALYVYRMREQTKRCIAIVTTLLKAYEAETGNRVAVEPGLLGEPLDVVADEGSDVFSQVPEAEPWGVVK